jgi:outer membrane protein OmpA-like peptidoglycan-associated protein
MLKNILYIIAFSIITTGIVLSQDDNDDFSDAEYSFESEEYDNALKLFERLLSKDPENSNLNYKVGICLLKIPEMKNQALPYFKKAVISVSPKYKEGNFKEKNAPIDAYFNLGNVLLLSYQINEAREAYQKYKSYLEVKDISSIDYVDQKIHSCDVAAEMMVTKVPFALKQLPDPILHNKPRRNVVTNGDGTELAFVAEKNGRQGIYFSQIKEDKWTAPIDITRNVDIDPKFDKFTLCSMSADGKRIYIKITNEIESSLFVSEFKSGRWKISEPLKGKVNALSEQTFASESPDGTQLFITSDRKGTLGGLDIFVSTITEKGQWGKPVNIGSNINTPFNEESPYITPDNQSLYFSSEGRNSMGGYDVYVSHRISGIEWSEPQNLGYPINSTDDDLFFSPTKDPNVGYFALHDSSSFISLVDLTPPKIEEQPVVAVAPEPLPIDTPSIVASVVPIAEPMQDTTAKPTPVNDTIPAAQPVVQEEPVVTAPEPPIEKIVFLRGNMKFSDDSHDIEQAEISVRDKDKNLVTTLKPGTDGNYILQLKPGTFFVEFASTGYNSVIKPIYIPDSSSTNEIILNSELQPISVKTGEYITIRSIPFNYNSVLIDKEGKIMLERLIRIMKDYPALMMEIIGHADSKGNPEYNRKLSLDRARQVSEYVISRGIEPTRFVVHGFGDAVSVAKNENEDGSDNPEGRRFNRRAEIRLLNCSGLQIVNEEISIPENLRVKDSYEYNICIAESAQKIDKSYWASKIDTSLIFENTADDKYVYTYSAPSSKGDALIKLKELTEKFPEAFIAPQKYFTPPSKSIESAYTSNYQLPSKFCIQLVALRNYIDVGYFKNLKDVIHHKGDDGLNRYTWGAFASYNQAYSYLPQVKKKGYSDAFVVPESKFTGGFIEKPLTGYTVQIHSSTTETDTTTFRPLTNIKVYRGQDKFYRYATGIFENYYEATQYLRKVKKNGFRNAYVRRISDLAQ